MRIPTLMPFCLLAWFLINGCKAPDPQTLASPEEHALFKEAVFRNDLQTIRSICSRNENFVHSVNENGFSPLIIVAFSARFNRNPTDAARIVVDEFGADVNFIARSLCNQTALHYASWGNPETFRFLVERGANVDAVDCEGSTPLHYAARHGAVENVRLLIEKEAKREVINKYERKPIDEVAILKTRNKKKHLIEPIRAILNK